MVLSFFGRLEFAAAMNGQKTGLRRIMYVCTNHGCIEKTNGYSRF